MIGEETSGDRWYAVIAIVDVESVSSWRVNNMQSIGPQIPVKSALLSPSKQIAYNSKLQRLVSSIALALPQLNSSLGPVVNLGYAAFVGNTTSPTGQTNGPVTFFVVDGGDVSITDARNWGPPCIRQPGQVGIGQEDCLLLNIWKPADAKESDKLPVVVYIHGGGFLYSTPQGFPMYDWVNQSNPKIVGVSIAYRLNLLGFLAGSSVQEYGDVNAGLLDQRAALEWVQRHIASFGGDPDEVTIDGESAGGASVVIQTVAYGSSKPVPFKRAIRQSIGYPLLSADEAEAAFKTVTEVVGCPSSGLQAMSCLRNASVSAIVAAINAVSGPGVVPTIGGPGSILPELPSTLIRSGNFSTVDFIGGHCTDDGRWFLPGTPADYKTDADVIRLVFGSWNAQVSNETKQEALALYPAPGTSGSPYDTQYDRAGTMFQELVFACMDWFLADRLQQEGVLSLDRFNSPNPVLLAASPWEGVMHTSDLFYLFSGTTSASNAGFTFTQFNSTEATLSRESISYWTSFISSGDASTSRLANSPEWLPFSTGSRMVLNQPMNSSSMSASEMEDTPSDEINRCKFWMSKNVTDQTRI
ncbi:alpha/beta-hydrolase [Fomitiporia mediterranea MF3/22]|uniref:alpha/beta-hydrolase n=1 Tax=Fomitiporia mediterranea (strain MF3/22) TaxID=694068 RepID=UPI000440735C|nr:alpha/beta-hydrolase [Fomitiporia mediterranea MF3/22]EJD05041.1 alpha/beta-hydrolase [Fomitiporia mediterranea MF3/22]